MLFFLALHQGLQGVSIFLRDAFLAITLLVRLLGPCSCTLARLSGDQLAITALACATHSANVIFGFMIINLIY